MPLKILGTLLAVPLAFSLPSANAAVIHGDVSLPKTNGRSLRTADVVVWLEKVPEKVERRLESGSRRWFWQKSRGPQSIPSLHEVGRKFEPRVVAVPTGRPLVIRNRDTVWHGAFSVSKGAAFELGKRPPGGVDTVRFARPGVVAMRCDIYPQMSGYVVVTPNHAYARPDSNGYWHLPSVPSGTYVLHAWHPDRSEIQRQVRMPARGDTLVALHW